MSRQHARDARRLADALAGEGFDVSLNGSGHWEVRHEGRRVTTFSFSPSCRRWQDNTLRYIRKWKREHGMQP